MQAVTLPTTETAGLSRAQLEQAFLAFNEASAQLGSVWGDLEEKVSALSRELAETRSARLRDLAEKERLADSLESVMAALPGAVVVVDDHGSVEDCNPAAGKLLGIAPGDDWQQLASDLETGGDEGEWLTADGRRLAVRYSELEGHRTRVAMVTDITENHRLSEAAHREQRLQELGDMAARLAHQVRTPLHSALLFLSLVEGRSGAVDAAAEEPALHRVREQLRKIERLVESTLTFIRGSAQAVRPLNLGLIAEETARSFIPAVEARGGRLVLELPDNSPLMLGQREAMENLLGNLLENALEAIDGTPRIIVVLAVVDGWLELRVSDNGRGIPRDVQQRIFDPWFTRRQHGTGLGLAVVDSAVRAHGGRVTVEHSDAAGSTFLVSLPGMEITGERRI